MKKLKNNSGATILMALLLILLAMAVGAVILTAAVGAAHHMKSDREAQQNYLTVSSAAELIRDSINGQTYERTLTVTSEAVRDEEGNITGYTVTHNLEVEPTLPLPGPMGAWLSACIEDGGETDYYASLKDFEDTIDVDLEIGNGTSLRTVKAAFSAQKDGKIQVQLFLEPETGKTDDCRMTLTMQGTLTKEGPETLPADEEYTIICKTKVTWGSPKIEKGIETKEAGT